MANHSKSTCASLFTAIICLASARASIRDNSPTCAHRGVVLPRCGLFDHAVTREALRHRENLLKSRFSITNLSYVQNLLSVSRVSVVCLLILPELIII